MPRFASKYARYSHGVPGEYWDEKKKTWSQTGRALEAQFRPGGLSEYEKETSLNAFRFHGLPFNSDTGEDVSGRHLLSSFDSEKAMMDYHWEQFEHDLVVDALRKSERLGADFIELTQPKRPIPWAGYDKLESASKIAEIVVATDTPVEGVIAYEKENKDREKVIAALEELLDPVEQEVTVQA